MPLVSTCIHTHTNVHTLLHNVIRKYSVCVYVGGSLDSLGPSGGNLEILLNPAYFVTQHKFMEEATDFLQNNVRCCHLQNPRKFLTYTRNVSANLGHCEPHHNTHTHAHTQPPAEGHPALIWDPKQKSQTPGWNRDAKDKFRGRREETGLPTFLCAQWHRVVLGEIWWKRCHYNWPGKQNLSCLVHLKQKAEISEVAGSESEA